MHARANRVKKIAVAIMSSEAVVVVCTRVIGRRGGGRDGGDSPKMYG
jgi:hypothetical protein